jgi:hypothetical protein
VLKPNFEDLSCNMCFGEEPPPLAEDEAFNQVSVDLAGPHKMIAAVYSLVSSLARARAVRSSSRAPQRQT